ncbi:hypothetical protein VNO77_34330 [Canavalia gladiata]|uniref:Uncharacterized protein n=1 Tax=Canavalia gladiata TaxID=3824 RepID=A0AAN9KG23_CANGL
MNLIYAVDSTELPTTFQARCEKNININNKRSAATVAPHLSFTFSSSNSFIQFSAFSTFQSSFFQDRALERAFEQ